MYGEKAAAMVQRLEQATWLPPYDDTMREVLTEIDELHQKAHGWLQYVAGAHATARSTSLSALI